MALVAGTRLGSYEILALIGAGGMGEVYRARDTRLDRDVAIKVLPSAVAQDPERLARFEREAKVLAALNHPNIAQIYGVEQGALVMELVEGETLPCPLPIETALPYAKQIAEAMEYAHERGVMHRDLKPANIKVTPEGTVKLLDFGLAKAIEDPIRASEDASNSPTLTLGATRVGMIMGTAAYMSPEQAGGKAADRRADIWSFGAVLYEMLAGKKAFDGESASDTLASVLKLEPDWNRLPGSTPAAIRHLIRRCLTKDRKQRLQAIGEARIVLQAPVEAEASARREARSRSPRLPWGVAAALAVIAAVFGWVAWRATRPEERPLIQLNAELAPDTSLALQAGGSVALSPDGTLLALVVRGGDGRTRLATRRIGQNQFTVLAGTEGAGGPFFSPDGRWIAFSTFGGLHKVSAQGGAPVTIGHAPSLSGSWGDDGTIVVVLGVVSVLSRAAESGGAPMPITRLNPGEDLAHRWPQVLPGSQSVLFTVYKTGRDVDESDIDVVSLKTGARKTLYHGGFFARYLPSGHLVFVHQNTLFAAPFDLRRLALTGPPQPVADNIYNQADNGGEFDFSQSGAFVYLAGAATLQRSIFWLDAAGRTEPLQPAPGLYAFPRFSPDGKRLAYALDDGQGHTNIWVRDLERNTTQRLTSLPGRNDWPLWTPDGKGIVFDASNPAAPGIYWMRSDGSGEAHLLAAAQERWRAQAISPDGKWLAVIHQGDPGVQILIVPLSEGAGGAPKLGTPAPFVTTPFITIYPGFSADGRWIAHTSGDPGNRGILVRPFPGPGGQWNIDSTGTYPVWSRAGHELFYLSDRRIMATSYTANGNTFVWDKPRVWSEKRVLNLGSPPSSTYDAAPDGKRFAVVLYTDGTAEEKPVTHATFLLNFFDELRRRVPEAK